MTEANAPLVSIIVPVFNEAATVSSVSCARSNSRSASWIAAFYPVLARGVPARDFDGAALGGLGWPPLADINHMLRIYDPEDYEKYRAGIPIKTDRIWLTKKRNRIGFWF